MFRYSRRWTWITIALAVLVLAAGAAAALLVWNARSSSTLEVLDPYAMADAAGGILDNTTSIALEWSKAGLMGDHSNLPIAQQESLALLSYEIDRAKELMRQALSLESQGDAEAWEQVNKALYSLLESQQLLKEALEEAGVLLAGLEPLTTADIAYSKGRETLISAVNEHNQAIDADSNSFTSARQEAASAIVSLQEAEVALQSPGIEGLNLEAATNAITGLKGSAEKFIDACDKGESGDTAAHNSLMTEVQTELSSCPTSIADSIDVGGWLQSVLEPYMEPALAACEETGILLEGI